MLRNSGTYDGLVSSWWLKLQRRQALRRGLKPPPPPSGPDDTLFKLQFYARLAIQYDMADLTAMLVVPICVTLFCARDGAFALEGANVLVRRCDLLNMWLHFGVLLVLIKPWSTLLARRIVARHMARTLLGMQTLSEPSVAFHHLLPTSRRPPTDLPPTSHRPPAAFPSPWALAGMETLHGRSAIAPDLLRTVIRRKDLSAEAAEAVSTSYDLP